MRVAHLILLLCLLVFTDGWRRWFTRRRRRRRTPTPVNGNWGSWSAYGDCSCLTQTKVRTRACNNPPPSNNGRQCVGIATETTACNRDCSDTCGLQRDLSKRDMGDNSKRFVWGAKRVVGGQNAAAHEWPWQINLRRNGRHICGGTIISSKIIVTAAHCVIGQSANQFQVRIGDHSKNTVESAQRDHAVKTIVVHPDYNSRTLTNDIAILEVNTPIVFDNENYHVFPICLPNTDAVVGSNCYITGWGRQVGGGATATILQEAPMPVISTTVCQQLASETFNNRMTITPGMICAGDGGVSNIGGCHGDSGGPFVCEKDGRWELHGAVSWGHGSCQSDKMYTVFARVNFYKQWILSESQKLGL